MHIACPEQSALKEVLEEFYISDTLLYSLSAQIWACYAEASILHPLFMGTSG